MSRRGRIFNAASLSSGWKPCRGLAYLCHHVLWLFVFVLNSKTELLELKLTGETRLYLLPAGVSFAFDIVSSMNVVLSSLVLMVPDAFSAVDFHASKFL